jgi:hypothetical protein
MRRATEFVTSRRQLRRHASRSHAGYCQDDLCACIQSVLVVVERGLSAKVHRTSRAQGYTSIKARVNQLRSRSGCAGTR